MYLKPIKVLKKGISAPNLACFSILCLLSIIINSSICSAEMLTASWYSVQSLKDEGTYKTSKGIMANGQQFNERSLTAASRDFPLGTLLKVINIHTGQSVIVKITDRCSKRFQGKRIDLSKGAFSQIACLEQGIIQVKIERIR